MNNYSVGLYTLGCKVSQYETEAIREEFVRRGFRIGSFDEACDAYIINTCTVTAESDRKSRQIIRRAAAQNKNAVIGVIGCYSQRSPKDVADIEGVSIVIGTASKMTVVDKVIDKLSKKEVQKISVVNLDNAAFEPMRIESAQRTRAYVKIEDGCECKCTYCAISGARGRVRSKLPEDVIAEVEGLYARGTREIVLTGIETGSYGKDFDFEYTLADLIVQLDRRGSCDRLRLGSLAPELVGEDFVQKVKGTRILAPHFHLSMQSGSDKILALMKRRYNSDMALKNIERIRENIPGAQFTTDLMVGFPGESEEDFLKTVELVRRARFIDAHVFAYSKRDGTPAKDYEGQIPSDVKKQRSNMLIKVKNEVRDGVLRKIVLDGKPLICVAESYDGQGYTSHSDSFAEVYFKADAGLSGKRVAVLPVSHKNGIITGKFIDLM